MDNLESLGIARKVRTDNLINRWRKDSVTGEVYTVRKRIERGAYSHRTIHIQDGKRISYGLILSAEIVGELDYLTPVTNSSKLAFDYASELPLVEFNENNGSIRFI